MKKALLFLMAIGLMSSSVLAQDVKVTGEKVPLTVVTDRAAYEAGLDTTEPTTNPETGETVEGVPTSKSVKLKNFNLLGTVDDKYAVITYKKGKEKGLVPLEEIEAELPNLDLSSFNSVSNWADITGGYGGDNVIRLQQNLTALGFLDAAIDGSYGSISADAVARFLQSKGLESAWEADAFTFLMIAEAVDGDTETIEIQYPDAVNAETKYARIFGDVADPSILENYLDRQWHFSYDAFEGKGTIENGEVFGVYEDTARPIDTINMTLSRAVRLARNDGGQIEVTPAVQVTSRGAYRPYVQSILLRNGSKVIELASFDSEGAVEGTDVVETTFVELTDEAEEMLGDENTEIRVKGSSKTYDL